jgi:hypothetical protein
MDIAKGIHCVIFRIKVGAVRAQRGEILLKGTLVYLDNILPVKFYPGTALGFDQRYDRLFLTHSNGGGKQ